MPACICRVPFCRPPAPTGAVSLPVCLKRIPRAPAIVKSPVSQLLFHYITSRAPPQGRPRPFSPFFRRARRKNGDGETGAGERRAQTGPGGECRGAGTGLPASPPGGNAGNERKPPRGCPGQLPAGARSAARRRAAVGSYRLRRLRRYRRAAPRRLPKVSAPSPQRLSSASVSHSAGSLPSPVSGTGSGSAVTRSVNTGLLVVPNVFVASQ